MAPMRRIRRDAKTLLLLGLGVVLALGAFSARQFRRDRSAARWVDHTQAVLGALDDYRYALKAAESARRGYVLTGSASDADAHAAAMTALLDDARSLRRLTADNPAQNARAASLEAATRTALKLSARLLARRRAGDVAGATRMVARREVAVVTDRALATERAMSEEERALLSERRARFERFSQQAEWSLAAGALAGCAGIALSLWLLLRDLGTYERLHRELERTKELLQIVLDNVRSSVYIIDLDGRMLFLNKECARTLGGTPESVAGRSVRDLFPAEQAAEVIANNLRIHAAGRAAEIEETVSSADGLRTYLSFKAPIAPLPAEGPALCGVSTDVTALKDHERRLESANKELEAFSYSVSHDLRAPLRAIGGFSRIIAEDHAAGLDPEGRRLFGRIIANSERMGRLIDDLLAFSRLGRQELNRADVDMTALAARAARQCADAEPERSVRLELGVLPPARGDAAMLFQVWTNLLSNAWKYTRPRVDAVVEIGGAVEDGADVYWIKDNGVGFDPRHAGKLFGVFSRLHGADEFEGTGVGLALVRRVVERHGGRVSAHGAVGAGAEFRFTLPHGRNA